ncbi:MAG: hypothetical protein IK088_07750 [Lachnospiraceae bacterium]|nr:hypothetical protein [Lachnospiraceae bacterium]
MATVETENEVLCGANSYEEKYYFNGKFANIPKDVQDELHAMCVLFTENVGGILTLEYLKDGTLVFRTIADDYDFYYDEIEAGLQIRALQKEKEELLQALELYYRTFILKEASEG